MGYKVIFVPSNNNLLIIDEVGSKKISVNYFDVFSEIVRRRYENGSLIITTNRSFEEWCNIFGDVILASTIIDRLIHHADNCIIGRIYRIKNLTKNVKLEE